MSAAFPSRPAPRIPAWLIAAGQCLALAALYVICARIGFRAAFVAEQVSPVWPATGLALAAGLYFGARLWPGVWFGAFVANITTQVPFAAACGIATGNTLEMVVAVWLLRTVGGVRRTLNDLRQTTSLLVFAALVSTAISATIGVATLCASGLQPWSRFGLLWSIWWLGDATGGLLVAPVLLTLPLWWRRLRSSPRVREAAALLVVTVALTWLVFASRLPTFAHHPLEFVVFPLVIWAGLRFAHPGGAVICATISAVAVWGTLQGTGPFNGNAVSTHESVILLQIYSAVLATTGLVFGAAIADRDRAERLRAVDHALTAILSEETDLNRAAPRILSAVCETLDWDVGMLWRTNEDRHVLEFVDSWQRDARSNAFVEHSRLRRFERGIGLPGRVWASARPESTDDVVVDSNFPRAPFAAGAGLHGGFAFPVVALVDVSIADAPHASAHLRTGPADSATRGVAGSRTRESTKHVLAVMEFFARDRRGVDPSLLTLMAAAGSQIGQFIERRHAQQRVADSEALNSAIVGAALDCVIGIDQEGRILEFNPAAARTFGISRKAAIGRELAELLVPARLRERHRESLRRCVASGESRILGTRLEMPALRGDGTEFPVELSITRTVVAGRPVFTAYLRDIVDRKRIDDERAALLAREHAARIEAEQANRSKDQFLATVSHELRTPLNAILGWSAILRTGRFDANGLAHIYESLYRNAEVQAQIVNDLLDVSRVVRGQLHIELEQVDVCELARLSLETIRPTAIAKRVALTADIPSARYIVTGDPARLQQVIWNLLSNAVKFTPAGGSVSLVVRTAESDFVAIDVADTGIGMPPAFLPHVFERFWQADSSTTRVHGGLGLGLAIVRHIVELHGGEVHAASEGEGRGSTFNVVLPASLRQPAVLAAPSGPAEAEEATVDVSGLEMLVVDDDLAGREVCTAILQSAGARVVTAASAAEAFAIVERETLKLMILDIGMPGENGLALLRRIRGRELLHGLRSTPAIAVTAYGGATAREQAVAAGFAVHLTKPVLPRDLLSAVRRVLSSEPLG